MADKIVQLIDKDGDNIYPVSVAYGFPTISSNVLETIGDITTDNTVYTVQNTGFLVGTFTCPPGNGGSSKVQIDNNGTWTTILTSGWLVASSDNRMASSFCIPVEKGVRLRFTIGTNMPISGVKIFKNNTYPTSATYSSNYSTVEQDTGTTWVDGKRIYKKTINFGSLPNATSKTVSTGISNMDYLVDFESTATNGTTIFAIPSLRSNSTLNIGIWFSKASAEVTIETNNNRTDFSAYVTMYYTKSS